MRAVIQRVTSASVSVDGNVISAIQKGLLVFLGVALTDEPKDLEYIVTKIVDARVFEDENQKMNRSIRDVGGEILLVSQFTLLGDMRKGHRPDFITAAKRVPAESMYEEALQKLRLAGITTYGGVFGADMQVDLKNDGPVTLLLDSTRLF